MSETIGRPDEAPSVELAMVLAENPGPMTLAGTNTYVLRDGDQVWVLDPGPKQVEHLAEVLTVCGIPGPVRPMGVIVTHRHTDHTEAAGTLRRQLESRSGLEVPLWAADPQALPGARPVPSELVGDNGVVAHVVHLPGHTADSIALLVEGGRLLCGDTLLGGSSTVISPPDGDLGEYLHSLAILRAFAEDGRISSIHPGHGPSYDTPLEALAAIEQAISHREERIEQVREARAAGVMTVDRLRRLVYGADLAEGLRQAADQNLRATLEHLSATE